MSVASQVGRAVVQPVASSVVGVSEGGAAPEMPTIEFVGTVSAAGVSGGTTTNIDTTTANLVVIAVTNYLVDPAPALVDSQGNTWTQLDQAVYNTTRCVLYYSYISSKSSTHNFSATTAGASFTTIRALVFRNALDAGFDVEALQTSTSNTTLATGSLTPTLPNSLFVSAVCLTTETVEPTYPSGFTGYWIPYLGATYYAGGMAYKIATNGDAINPTWSWTNANEAAGAGAVFKPQS